MDEDDDEPPPEVLPYIGGDLLPKETDAHNPATSPSSDVQTPGNRRC